MAAGRIASIPRVNGNIPYGDLSITFIKKKELLVDLCQRHAVLPITHNCKTSAKVLSFIKGFQLT